MIEVFIQAVEYGTQRNKTQSIYQPQDIVPRDYEQSSIETIQQVQVIASQVHFSILSALMFIVSVGIVCTGCV